MLFVRVVDAITATLAAIIGRLIIFVRNNLITKFWLFHVRFIEVLHDVLHLLAAA